MNEYYEDTFWETIYNEFGVVDELDILSEDIEHIIYPAPGIIIFLTKDYHGEE